MTLPSETVESRPAQSQTLIANSLSSRHPHRPFTVTLLGLGVLMFAWLNLLRMVLSIQQWSFLADLGIVPLYIAISGLVWGLAWLVLFWGLWRGRAWVRRGMQVAAPLYALYVWLDRILPALRYQPLADALPSSWPFLLVLTILLLAYALLAMIVPENRAYLSKKEPDIRSTLHE